MTETGGPQQGRAAGLPCVVAPQKGRGLGAQRAVCKPQNRLLNLLKPWFPALKWQNAISSRQESMRRGKEAQNTGRDLCAQVAGAQVMQGAGDLISFWQRVLN